ncbi:MAG: hypothetical protein ABID63_01170 [Pseudomonadota bacterium]
MTGLFTNAAQVAPAKPYILLTECDAVRNIVNLVAVQADIGQFAGVKLLQGDLGLVLDTQGTQISKNFCQEHFITYFKPSGLSRALSYSKPSCIHRSRPEMDMLTGSTCRFGYAASAEILAMLYRLSYRLLLSSEKQFMLASPETPMRFLQG